MAAGGSTKVVLAAMTANFGIATAKLAAATYTGSSAMLSEAVHSLIDTSNQALLLYGLRRAARPADARHPFGYAKELYFWSFVVAILLFSMGAGVAIYEGVDKLVHPHPVTNPLVNYGVLGVAILLEAGSCWVALQEFNAQRGAMPFVAALRTTKDAALITVLLEDIAAMAGLTVALAGVAVADRAGIPEADGAASIAIGLVLAAVAAFIAIEVKGLLTDEAASDEVQADVRDIIAAEIKPGGIIAIVDLRTLQLGASRVLVAATVDVDDAAPAAAIEAMNARIEAAVRARIPVVQHLYLEVASADSSHAPLEPRAVGLETKSMPPVPAAVVVGATDRLAEAQSPSGQKSRIVARQPGKQGRGKRRR